MNLKQVIKKVLDEQVWALNQTPDTELPSDVKPAKFTPTQPKKDPKETTKTIERVEIGWSSPDKDIVALSGCPGSVEYYKNIGFSIEGKCPNFKISGWGFPLIKSQIKQPTGNQVFGAPRSGGKRKHDGVDFSAVEGTDIYSVRNGKVKKSGDIGGNCGTGVILTLDNNYTTVYCHMSKTNVPTGSDVKVGQKIGEVGSTGHSDGSHLHIKIQTPSGQPIDSWSSIYSQLV